MSFAELGCHPHKGLGRGGGVNFVNEVLWVEGEDVDWGGGVCVGNVLENRFMVLVEIGSKFIMGAYGGCIFFVVVV